MLQMECPTCDLIITSPFLAEISSINCKACDKDVLVKDVFVSTRAFTMNRDVLLRRITHYRTLLKQIERELAQAKKSKEQENGTNSLEQLYCSLQELMSGARANYRLSVPHELSLDMEVTGRTCHGRLVNLSTKGAAILLQRMMELPKQGAKVLLRTTLPEGESPLLLDSSIVWTANRGKVEGRGCATLGVTFNSLAGVQHKQIWEYIVKHQETYN